MKISCLQENLSRGLAVVGRAVANRATLPVTQNVLLSVDQSMLKLSATNLEIAMTTWVPPSAFRSKPRISMVRISWMLGGNKLILVRIKSGTWSASLRLRLLM